LIVVRKNLSVEKGHGQRISNSIQG
jgi:hypothetical protein